MHTETDIHRDTDTDTDSQIARHTHTFTVCRARTAFSILTELTSPRPFPPPLLDTDNEATISKASSGKMSRHTLHTSPGEQKRVCGVACRMVLSAQDGSTRAVS